MRGNRIGELSGLHPVDLGVHVLTALTERTGFAPADVEDVIFGGAAVVAVTTSEWAAAHGPKPLARLHTCVVVSDDPVVMMLGCFSCGGMAEATVLELLA